MAKKNLFSSTNIPLTVEIKKQEIELVFTKVEPLSNKTRYYGDGNYDLRNLIVGSEISFSGFTNSHNNGTFHILSVSDGYIDVDNLNSVYEEASVNVVYNKDITMLYAGGGSLGKCKGVYNPVPVGTDISNMTLCEVLVSVSPPNLVSFYSSPTCGLVEYHTTITNPVLSYRATRGNNGADLDRIEITRNSSLIYTEQPADYDIAYSHTDNVTINDTNVTYQAVAYDVLGNASNVRTCRYEYTWAYFGTSEDITILTKQNLVSLSANYFQIDMVAETDTDKQKAEFHESITITGVEFYNTVSGEWEWLGGDKATSLTYWDTTTVVKDINGTSENYVRYTYNGVKVGERQLRFWRV